MKTYIKIISNIIGGLALLSVFACDKFLDVDTPSNIVDADAVYSDARVVRTAVNGLYTQLLLSNYRIYPYVTYFLSLAADEAFHTSTSYDDLRYSAYTPISSGLSYLWEGPYIEIFTANDLLARLPQVTVISAEEREQYIGEAKYFRAYAYLALVSTFGGVPLVESTNLLETTLQPRESKENVQKFIIQDLKDAEIALKDSENPNTKVTKAAASALLARAYLYHEDWSEAESKANEVITTSGYKLEDSLNNVFLRTSKEVIFKTSSTGTISSYVDRTYHGQSVANTSSYRLTDDLVNSFEVGDRRKARWTIARQVISSDKKDTTRLRHSYKYKKIAAATAGTAEDFSQLRLAEQFLIRAEARAQQNKLTGPDGAIADLDTIRRRAGLAKLPQTLTKAEVLLQVEKERRSELFFEEAHRWWDLVRTGRADAVLSVFPGKKWESYRVLLPIPDAELEINKNLVQNPGYGTIR
jgi:hypothetical protein